MKQKIYNLLNILNLIATTTLLIITPLYLGMHKDSYLNSYLFVFLIIDSIAIIQYILKPYKLNKKLIFYFLFILTYLIPLFSKDIIFVNTHIKITILIFLCFIMSININHLFEKNLNKLHKIIIASATITGIISMLYVFIPTLLDKLMIIGDYGDFYLSSIYRLYGTLVYPNSLALLCLIGIILSLKYLDKNIYKYTLYINILTLFLTISKSTIIFAIITFIIFSILNKQIRQNLISLILPIMYNINIYRECIINNQLLNFIIITTILFIIYLIMLKIIQKKKFIFITISILIIALAAIYPSRQLTIEKNNNSDIFIVDFMGLQEGSYEITLKLDADNFDGNVYLYKQFIQKNNLSFILINQTRLKKNKKFRFNVTKDSEYYSLKISNKLVKFKIKEIKITNGKETKRIETDYNLWPYNYVKSLEQIKYDKTSVQSRLDIYKLCIKIIKDNPIFGHGYDYFRIASSKTKNLNYVFVEHSQIMALGVQNGIISILAWIILIILIVYYMIKKLSIKNLNIILVILLLIYTSLYDFSMSYNYFLLLLFIYSMILINTKK